MVNHFGPQSKKGAEAVREAAHLKELRACAPFTGYWFKVPAELAVLMLLSPAELKVYLVVIQAIQRDRNGGLLAVSQLAKRASLSERHARKAAESLCSAGLLNRVNRATGAVLTDPEEWNGRTVKYGHQTQWKQKGESNPSPVGDRLDSEPDLRPVGESNPSPVGQRHSESLELREQASASQSAFPSQKGFSASAQKKRITPEASEKAPMPPQSSVGANVKPNPKPNPKNPARGKADSKADAPAKTAGEENPACAEEPWTDWDIGQLKFQLSMFMDGEDAPDNVVSSILHLAAQYRLSPAAVFDALDAAWSRRAAPGKKNAPRKWNWFYEVLRNAFDPNYAARPRECPAAPWAEDRVKIGSEPFNVSDDDLGVPF